MKSFLCKNKKPICRWTYLKDNTFWKGSISDDYSIGVCPGKGYIVVDVDRHGDKNGFNVLKTLSSKLQDELTNTFHYPTKNNGEHFWFKYTGTKNLLNKASNVGIDLRVENKGYVIWYSDLSIKEAIPLIKESSVEMNKWIESLFT